MNEVLAYVAAGPVALWGVAHAVPTRQVLAGFDPITGVTIAVYRVAAGLPVALAALTGLNDPGRLEGEETKLTIWSGRQL